MPPTCHLHVGGYKTGTTYLQRRLIDGRAALRAAGVLVPGTKGIGEHVRAGKVVMERPDLRGQPIPERAWHDLRDEMLGYDGHTAVYSYEELVGASRSQAARMITDLAPADVRIVLTVRDLVRVVPAAWQEVMQGGQQWSWEHFVDVITSADARQIPPGRTFWRNNDMLAVATRWAAAAGADRVTIVTVPPSGASPDVLWQRFCAAIGVDPQVVPADRGADNESLDVTSAELLRQFNMRAADLPMHVYDREVKWFLAKEVLAARSGPDRVRLAPAQVDWARAEGERTAAGLRALGVRVEGDLDDLVGAVPRQDGPAGPDGAVADPAELLDAALDAMVALVARLGARPPARQGGGPHAAGGQRPGGPRSGRRGR